MEGEDGTAFLLPLSCEQGYGTSSFKKTPFKIVFGDD